MFYNARYYSPLLGRFLSADTIVPSTSDPQQLNRFSYVRNNPLRHIDPSGHMCLENEFSGQAGPCQENPQPLPPLIDPFGQWYTERYGWFDNSHIGAASPAEVIAEVRRKILNGGGQVPVKGVTAGGFRFRCTYEVAGVDNASEQYILGVALGIYMDYEQKFETWEGSIVPGIADNWTGYAVEDLPSDYLGFVIAAYHMTYEEAFAYLGPVTNHRLVEVQWPIGSPTMEWQVAAPRGVKNHSFSPLVNGVNVPWPAELTITPIDSGGAWGFVGSWGSSSIARWLYGWPEW